MSAIEQARTAGPEVTAAPAEAELAFATRRKEAEEFRLKIEREERKLATRTRYEPAERTMLEGKLATLLDKKGIAGPERAKTERDYRKQIEDPGALGAVEVPDFRQMDGDHAEGCRVSNR